MDANIKHSSLDTLAQLRKIKENNIFKRARSKWYTQAITGGLIHLDSDLKQYYRNAYYCNDSLVQEGDTLKSANHYCNTRVCNVCNRIRTAQLMNQYVGQLGKLNNLEFVTLTLPNVEEGKLLYTIENMNSVWYNIRQSLDYHKIKLSGIRKLEITYNAVFNTYHPHYHIIVDGNGKLIINEWLKRMPKANIKGQDCRNADQGSLNELFKYATKIIDRKKNNLTVYIKAIDVIMRALSKKRSIQPFGIIKKVSEDIDEASLNKQGYNIPEYDFMEWHWHKSDWVNKHGEFLTGYIEPDVKFVYK